MLVLQDVSSSYGAIQALKGINLRVEKGEIVTLIGANGAGKTTTLRTITGLVQAKSGSVMFEDRKLNEIPTHKLVALGICMVPEGRAVFSNLTVMENLEMGAYLQRDRNQNKRALDRVCELFPRLSERRKQAAGTLSGGEQQMLAIGRALMAHPRLLLLDEPSLGLAPILVHSIFEAIDQIVCKQKVGRSAQVSGRTSIQKQSRVLRQSVGVSMFREKTYHRQIVAEYSRPSL